MKIERAIELLDPACHKITDAEEIDAACRMGMDALRRLIPCAADDKNVNRSWEKFRPTFPVRCGFCHEVYEVAWPRCFYPFCPICGQRQAPAEDKEP